MSPLYFLVRGDGQNSCPGGILLCESRPAVAAVWHRPVVADGPGQAVLPDETGARLPQRHVGAHRRAVTWGEGEEEEDIGGWVGTKVFPNGAKRSQIGKRTKLR